MNLEHAESLKAGGGLHRWIRPAGRGLAILLTLCGILAHSEEPPAPPSSTPRDFLLVDDCLYFCADDGIHGRELWMWDVRNDCRLVHDFVPGPEGSGATAYAAAGDLLYIFGNDAHKRASLWQWNRGKGSIDLLYSAYDDEDSASLRIHPGFTGTGCFFVTLRGDSKVTNVWALSPGETKFRRLTDFSEDEGMTSPFDGRVMADGTDVFLMAGHLWRSDGTPQGTVKVAPSGYQRAQSPWWMHGLDRRVILKMSDPDHGPEPWITDGTPEGTRLLRDIRPGPETSAPGQCKELKGKFYFAANDGEHGLELWVTDGTPEGTVLLKDVSPGRASSDPHYFEAAGDLMYFSADNGVLGVELWCTDGTPEGTRLVKDVNPSLASSSPYHSTAVGNLLAFCATTPSHGDAIWLTDGTAAGTRLMADIIAGPGPGGPDNLISSQGQLVFTYDEPMRGEELWRSDPATGKTELIADINAPRFNPSAALRSLTRVGDRLFFSAPDLDHGQELWTSGGTEDTTRNLKDIATGPVDSDPEELTPAGDALFFTAANPEQGRELWRSDGTPEGTSLFLDLRAGPASSDPGNLVWCGGSLLFSADDGRHGLEPWASDGTPAGTRLAADLTRGSKGTSIRRLLAFQGRAYAYAGKPDGGVTLYDIGLAGEAPRRVLDLPSDAPAPALEELVAKAAPAEMLLPWIYPCRMLDEAEPVQLGNAIYFVAHTPRHGSELWQTDGSAAGTRLVCDAFPGRGSSSPRHLVGCENRVYFIGDHPDYGQVLWSTDGTPLGSEAVRPNAGGSILPPLPALSMAPLGGNLIVIARRPSVLPDFADAIYVHRLPMVSGAGEYERLGSLPLWKTGTVPRDLTSTGARIYFVADDGVHGEELWTLDENQQASLVKDILMPGNLLPLRK